jgi:hypothetical protein
LAVERERAIVCHLRRRPTVMSRRLDGLEAPFLLERVPETGDCGAGGVTSAGGPAGRGSPPRGRPTLMFWVLVVVAVVCAATMVAAGRGPVAAVAFVAAAAPPTAVAARAP